MSSNEYLILYGGQFWNGFKFVRTKDQAITVTGAKKAWEYVDQTFGIETAEDITIQKK